MNYEDFSPEAQKVIDQFRGLIENIKSRKNQSLITYSYGKFIRINYIDIGSMVLLMCAINNTEISKLETNISFEILRFIESKNYFLPKFLSDIDYQQNKHKYSFIKDFS